MNTLKDILSANNRNGLFLIAGPCVIENKETPFEIAAHLKELSKEFNIPIIFKASYRKANRTSLNSFTGIGDLQALEIIKEIGDTYDMLTTTDIHTEQEAALAAGYVDMIQIPAFLCRQTSLLKAAAQTKIPINIKKGQFLSAEAMKFVVEKVRAFGGDDIVLTERGTTFGYQDLVVDFRGISIMQSFEVPVIMDCTHSLQRPNQSVGVTGGAPNMIDTIAKAAVAVGTNGLFIETHPNPELAKSDGKNMLPLDQLRGLIEKVLRIKQATL